MSSNAGIASSLADLSLSKGGHLVSSKPSVASSGRLDPKAEEFKPGIWMSRRADRSPDETQLVSEGDLTRGELTLGVKQSRIAELEKHIDNLSGRVLSLTRENLDLNRDLRTVCQNAAEALEGYRRRLESAEMTSQQLEASSKEDVGRHKAALASEQKARDVEVGRLRAEIDSLTLQLSQTHSQSVPSSQNGFAPGRSIW